MATEEKVRGAFMIQEHYCREMDGAPVYARLCRAIASGLTRETELGARILDWPGEPTRDALPLRLIGGLHALVLADRDAELAEIFDGTIDDDAAVADKLGGVLRRHVDTLMPWLNGPPQTNEVGRATALIYGIMQVARRFGPRIEILEIGSSGGLNLLIDRYRFDLGGAMIGPPGSPLTITPDWHGEKPSAPPIEIVSTRGCDVAPLDVTDPAVAMRLAAYVWAETPARRVRLGQAIDMVRTHGVRLDKADAADWIEARLAEPQLAGVARVLMHSVVWQYLPDPVAERIRVAMATAGAAATAERPLAWVAMEPDRALAVQLVSIRCWPGPAEREVIATVHPHGSWIKPGPLPEGLTPNPLVEAAARIRL